MDNKWTVNESSKSSNVFTVRRKDFIQNIDPTSEAINNPFTRILSGENIRCRDDRSATNTRVPKDQSQPVSARSELADRAETSRELNRMKLLIGLLTIAFMGSLTLLLVTNTGLLSPSTCPEDWVNDSFGNCYIFIGKKASWLKAEGICVDMGGTLASFANQEQMNWLYNYIRPRSNLKSGNFWIGGYYDGKDWKWKGKIVDLIILDTDWAENEPNSKGENENCLELSGYLLLKWNDQPCEMHLSFICKRKQFDTKWITI